MIHTHASNLKIKNEISLYKSKWFVVRTTNGEIEKFCLRIVVKSTKLWMADSLIIE